MFSLRSAQGRALAAGVVLPLLLVAVAALATWRTQHERSNREEQEQRAAVVAALDDASAQFYRATNFLAAAVLADDPAPAIDAYRQALGAAEARLEEARTRLVAVGDGDQIAGFDSVAQQVSQFDRELDTVLDAASSLEGATRLEIGRQYYPQMSPRVDAMMASLDALGREQQARMAAESAAADKDSDAALLMLLGLSAFAFLGSAATLVVLVVSVARPLAALRDRAKAVASGNLDVRAKVAGPTEVASLAHDFNEMIDQRKRVEEALRDSETRYRHIFESIQDIFYRTDAQGIIVEISPSVERVGYGREQLIGTSVLDVYEDPEQRATLVKTIIEKGEVSDYEIRLRRGDGRVIDISISAHALRDSTGAFVGTEGVLRDISERKRAEEALREQARLDPLTGTLNHGAILEEMRRLVFDDDGPSSWAVAMVDVDHLKVTNDTCGHQVGDDVLCAVAAALSRSGALVGRYGGDEFVAVLQSADRKAAEDYRKDALAALRRAALIDPQSGEIVPVAASIGLAVYPEDGSTVANLIKSSDAAMYAAKRQRPFRRPGPRRRTPGKQAA